MEISALEAQTGLGRDAIRYYERRGLLGKIPRGSNNYRDYPASLVKEIKLLRSMQSLGFSLDEIQEVLNGLRSGGIQCKAGAELLAEKRRGVEQQIRSLREVSRLLALEQSRLEDRARRHARR
ncbi:MerR family transcriptional regulator [Caenimonas sedimenti]|uniref:MerR family transcriptional regulator n=1 Tax=Caenimonas sedimenti TaxID=2596921 RepID=A0A562ZQM7_9BURK|nr:MerR family transcriptional regulator [Caenimonas sedimenti]TWO70646.1 MerR family transcriptional regulator [Caenimonas sedimenti]